MLYFLFGNNYSGGELFAIILAFVFAICIAMTFHEWAHAYSALKCGDDTAKLQGRLTLNPLSHVSGIGLLGFLIIGIGWAKPVPVNPAKFRSYKKNATWVFASGVLTNFILAFIFTGFLYIFGGMLIDGADNLLCFFLYNLIWFGISINLSLCIFNLLPIPPLDGFNILSIWTKYNNRVVQFLSKYGMFLLIILILPFINGNSLLSLFYSGFVDIVIKFFGFFWGIFV